ncbi:hypothetical protein [Aliidiomarina sp.]|uniref:hypothetical protein n=1 Tax=Aliidiomarina sp. TaxID=1872439 RepID=UPI003A4D8A28
MSKVFSIIWRSLFTIVVTLIVFAFITTGYVTMEDDKKRLEQHWELGFLQEAYFAGDYEALNSLQVRYVNLQDNYFIHNEGRHNQRYSFKFLFADDNPRMSGRTVYSYHIPESFSQVPIVSLASDPRVYALDAAAEIDYLEEETHGLGFFIFICVLVLYPYLMFLVWIRRGHKRITQR